MTEQAGSAESVENRPRMRTGSAAEVFGVFLKLGLTSFGGPVAHLGYFRSELVERRRWLDDQSYSDLVALCHRGYRVGKLAGAASLGLFLILLVGLPLLFSNASLLPVAALASFYKAGALVFGGGHVVLPLLQAGVVPTGLVSNDVFLAGYGAAQAVPGPLFTFAAYLGASMPSPLGGWPGGCAALVAVFLPGYLLIVGALPFWELLRQRRGVQRAMAGVNAAVVGILGAALYDPVWTSAVHTRSDFGLALAAFGLLLFGEVAPVWVVLLCAACGWLLR